jgi:ribosomal protein S27AE
MVYSILSLSGVWLDITREEMRMVCAKKISKNCVDDYYPNDSTCKECRKQLVRENRAKNADYYRNYDKKRFKEDPRVSERHKKYQQTEAGKASIDKSKKKWTAQNPVKRSAAWMVGNAVRDGRLMKQYSCSECGSGGRIHGHHDDYAFPLVVRWLCGKCHTQWHHENGQGKNG